MVEDKLSMAHSLEARVPFLDNDLVDFAMGCRFRISSANLGKVERQLDENQPGPKTALYSTRPGWQDLLREAMARYVPAGGRERREAGLFRAGCDLVRGKSIDYVRRVLV